MKDGFEDLKENGFGDTMKMKKKRSFELRV
jgi:hypothetical protein